MITWTDELDDRIEELRGRGLTCEEIGRMLGTTKNAIVGRLNRLRRERERREAPPSPRPTAPLGQPAPLLRLDPDGCRWPVSPHSATSHVFCNAHRMPDRVYCRRHWLKAIGGHP